MVNWLQISQSSGYGRTDITITASSYSEAVDRITSLVVSGQTISTSVTVTQLAEAFDVDVQELCFSNRFNLVREVNVSSSASGWFITSKPDWLSIGPTSGEVGTTSMVIIADSSNSARTGNIVMTNGYTTKTIPVSQKVDYIYFRNNAGAAWFRQSGGTKTFSVTATTTSNWSATTDSDWVSISPSSGAAGTSVSITVSAGTNDNFDSRAAKLTFTCLDTGSEFPLWTAQPGTNEAGKYLYYKSSNGSVVSPNTANWGASIVSNTYQNGQGLITFSEPIACIAASGFNNKYTLSEIVIPPTVKTINGSAFYYTDLLTAVTVPSSVEYVGPSAFYNCFGLTGVSLPNVTVLDDNSFYHCTGVTSYDFPNLVEVGTQAFSQANSMGTFTLPNTFRKFKGSNTFQYSNLGLEHVVISDGMQDLPENTFDQCHKLQSVSLPSTTRSIARNAFYDTWVMTDLYIHARKAPTISPYAFEWLGYKSGTFTSGTLHYPAGSDYSYIISRLPSTWTAVADL